MKIWPSLRVYMKIWLSQRHYMRFWPSHSTSSIRHTEPYIQCEYHDNGLETLTINLTLNCDIYVFTCHLSSPPSPPVSRHRWNHPMIVNVLLLFGAQYSVTNSENKTPVELTKASWSAGTLSSLQHPNLHSADRQQYHVGNLR